MSELLVIERLWKSFGGLEAVAGLELTLAAGGLLCLIGPNGCGKTTLFNLITGALRPDGGRIRFAGRDIAGLAPHRIARRGIGRKFQVPAVYPELSVAENLEVPLFARRGRRGLLGLVGADRRGDAARGLLELCRLEAKAWMPAAALAHGEKQWLEIAMLLATRPRLMLLDEPTAGMSAAETRATARLLRGIHASAGIAAVVIEHDLGFVRELGAEVAVMLKGRIVRRGGYDEIRADPLVREVYLGRRA